MIVLLWKILIILSVLLGVIGLGLFGFPVHTMCKLCEKDMWLLLLGSIILLPLTMLYGVFTGMR